MSDGLRFIRFSVASPAGEDRVGMLYPISQPFWDISTLHPILFSRESTGTGAHPPRTYM